MSLDPQIIHPPGKKGLAPLPYCWVPLMFAVKPLGSTVHLQHAPKVDIAKRLADDGAVETTVEHALMRGLVTA